MFIARGLLKMSVIDDYEQGEIGGYQLCSICETWNAQTADDVIKSISDFVGTDDFEKNACDEMGRVYFFKMENSEGKTPSKSELSKWKLGRVKLWAVTYSAFIERAERVRV